MNEEKIHKIGDQEVKETDLTPEQHHHKNHVISLRKWHENAMLETTKPKEDQASEEE